MIRTGGIPEARSNAAVALVEEVFGGRPRIGDAPLLAGAGVQICRERLGEPVGERLRQNGVVIVVRAFELVREFVGADTGGDGERADVDRERAPCGRR